MVERIKDLVTVGLWSDPHKKEVLPKVMIWQGKNYLITQVGLHHTYREGRTLYHVFSVMATKMFFRLRLNSEKLVWTLEEVSDGLSN